MMNTGDITVNFNINDRAYSGSSVCSGIDRVEAYDKDNPSFPYGSPVFINSSSCSLNGGALVFSASSVTDGEHTLCLAGYDKMGNGAQDFTNCHTFIVDKTAPSIADIQIIDSAGNDVSFVPPSGKYSSINVRLNVDHAGVSTATADLSDFEGGYNTLPLNCFDIGVSQAMCTGSFTALVADGKTSEAVTITVTDKAGNVASQTKTFNVVLDDTAPSINKILTHHKLNGSHYVKRENNIVFFELADSGSGVKNEGVSSNLASFFTSVGEPNCTSISTGNWRCTWTGLDLKGSYKSGDELSIKVDVTDEMGNTNSLTDTLLVDTEQPYYPRDEEEGMTSSELNTYGGIDLGRVIIRSGDETPFLTSGSALTIFMNVTDDMSLKDDSGNLRAFADLSMLGGSNMTNADDCNEIEEEIWKCQWSISNIHSTSTALNIGFNISDFVGNNKEADVSNFIVQYVDSDGDTQQLPEGEVRVRFQMENVSDFWDVSAGEHSPNAIDRTLSSVLPGQMYFKLDFEELENDIEILSFGLKECFSSHNESANETNFMQYVATGSPKLYRAELQCGPEKDCYLHFTLSKGYDAIETNLENILCQFKIVSLYNEENITQPETENVSITIPLYNMPLGTLDEKVKDEIEERQNGWLVSQGWLDGAEKLLDLAEKICSIVNLWFRFTQLAAIFKSGTAMPCAMAHLSGYGQSICELDGVLSEKTGTTSEVADRVRLRSNQYCKLLSCQLYYGSDKFDCWGDSNTIKGEGTTDAFNTCMSGKQGKTREGMGNFANYLQDAGKSLDPSCEDNPSGKCSPLHTGGKFDHAEGSGYYYSDTLGGPQDSLTLSIAFFCLPGIIHNLQKARVIDCTYISCLANSAASGTPINLCVAQRSYAYCRYVFGEIFSLIPFASAINSFMQNIYQQLVNPTNLILAFGDLACREWFCKPENIKGTGIGTGVACAGCMYANLASTVLDLACDLGIGEKCEESGMFNGRFMDLGDDEESKTICEQVNKDNLDVDDL